MSNWNTQKVKTLKKRWAEITSGRNASDHALASWASQAIKIIPNGKFQEFCTSSDGLGRHANTARQYERMVKALESVPDRAIWTAVGWSGVMLLARIEKKRERSSLSRWVVTQARKKPVTETALEKRITDKAPSYKKVGGGGGGRNPNPSGLRAEVEKLTHKNATLSARFDELVSDLTRVVAKYPVVKNDLSKGTINSLGITGGQLPKVKSA